jgi:hypothetical protein
VEKPSDDINSCLFLMNKKGLKAAISFLRFKAAKALEINLKNISE